MKHKVVFKIVVQMKIVHPSPVPGTDSEGIKSPAFPTKVGIDAGLAD